MRYLLYVHATLLSSVWQTASVLPVIVLGCIMHLVLLHAQWEEAAARLGPCPHLVIIIIVYYHQPCSMMMGGAGQNPSLTTNTCR